MSNEMIKKLLILRVQHAQITIPKGAEPEAREFYCGVLGLQEIPKPESLQTRGGFWLEVGAFQVHVGTEDGFDRRSTKAHIAYEVEDLEAWRGKLSENNVEILEGIPIPHYRRFEFRDPFGNRVEFLEKIERQNH
jgi:catechol 2,3-dioxygenase-like lactoylglutathione lyase family enzyme